MLWCSNLWTVLSWTQTHFSLYYLQTSFYKPFLYIFINSIPRYFSIIACQFTCSAFQWMMRSQLNVAVRLCMIGLGDTVYTALHPHYITPTLIIPHNLKMYSVWEVDERQCYVCYLFSNCLWPVYLTTATAIRSYNAFLFSTYWSDFLNILLWTTKAGYYTV